MSVARIGILSSACGVAVLAAAIAFQSPAPAAAAAQDGGRGATIFQQRCAVCHSISGKGGKIGPDLTTVVGRRAGGSSFTYSPALKRSTITWNAQTLDGFLAAPTRTVPGTRMTTAVANPQDRTAIVNYLATRK